MYTSISNKLCGELINNILPSYPATSVQRGTKPRRRRFMKKGQSLAWHAPRKLYFRPLENCHIPLTVKVTCGLNLSKPAQDAPRPVIPLKQNINHPKPRARRDKRMFSPAILIFCHSLRSSMPWATANLRSITPPHSLPAVPAIQCCHTCPFS